MLIIKAGSLVHQRSLGLLRLPIKNLSTCEPVQFHVQSHGKSSIQQLSVCRENLRNVGIVAHINAGKTTTTERILYHAGQTRIVGDVDLGSTVTDYLEQERDRGITITSAAVSFPWRKNQVNLIDTPGHVDFTVEVERSLSVLDGVAAILDASAGVEAQTITVWNQASRFALPNLIFLNKYDKPLADYRMCMKELSANFDINPSLVQLPVVGKRGLCSLIDLVNSDLISWDDPSEDNGSKFNTVPLNQSNLPQECQEQAEAERERLINFLTDLDDDFAAHVIECDKMSNVSAKFISKAIRRATLSCHLSPVLVGSSFRYIGVQQLMDAIVDYLPSPLDREKQILEMLRVKNLEPSSKNCAFIFKIMHDKRLGPLSYVRVFNGFVKSKQRFKTLEGEKVEQVKKVYRAFGDELEEIDVAVGKDDIVVVTGLSDSRTGDILVDEDFKLNSTPETKDGGSFGGAIHYNEAVSSRSNDNIPFSLLNRQFFVPQISRMEPVYFCCIESLNAGQQLKLEHALSCLSREDPSFAYETDQLGTITIMGMGKLHLEVIRDRIQSEYGLDPSLGPLQISYRETIRGSAVEELNLDRMICGVKNQVFIKLNVSDKPKSGVWSPKRLRIDLTGFSGESSLARMRSEQRRAIENGFMASLSHGPSMGFQMIDCDIILMDFKANSRCGLPVISSAASQCLRSAMLRCSPIVLEPIMLLEVVVPKRYNGAVLNDISMRRGIIVSTSSRGLDGADSIIIRSHTPLATLSDYSEHLRITTSGRGSFSMELFSYSEMSASDKQSLARV